MKINVKDFFETQYKTYATYDSERSIANVIDGQKITARKVLFTSAKRSNTEIKVAQLCSQVAYETAFHHGEVGIAGVICNLAQSFAGSNNVNLLEPIGQFGSRLSSIPAAARYIFTKLTPEFRLLFKKEDDLIIDYNYDDEQQIEPKFYVPILPVVLLNGTQGIGTGFASKVLSYNPTDIKNDIISILKNEPRKKLIPWYKGFNGTITPGENDNQWIITGKLEITNTTTIKITEIPVGTYLDDIKSTLSKLKEKGIIKDYDDDSTVDGFDIEVTVPRTTTSLPIDKLYELFKLVSKDTENLTLWNTNHKLQVYDSVSEIVRYFVDYRLLKYEERRLKQIELLNEDLIWSLEKQRFIQFYIENSKLFASKSKKELEQLLVDNSFIQIDNLLQIRIYNLTKDDIDKLDSYINKLNKDISTLSKTTPQKMYLKELEDLKF
jgi:DNA topoisomerase-2